MALTLPEALKRAAQGGNAMLAGIAQAIVTTDELANVLPLQPVSEVNISYRREGSLPSTAWLPDSGVSSEESAGTDDNVVVPVRRIVGNVDVDALADALTGNAPGEQRSARLVAKIKATWREAMLKLVNGGWATSYTVSPAVGSTAALALGTTGLDGISTFGPGLDSNRFGAGTIKYTHAGTLWQFRAPGDVTFGDAVAAATDDSYTLYSWNKSRYIVVTLDVSDAAANHEFNVYFASSNNEFDGMKSLLGPGMTVDPVGGNGDAFDFGMLDHLMSLEKVRQNRAFIMNSALVEKFYAANRALGGTQPTTIQLPNYGQPVPTYRGVPLITNDNCLSDETVGTGTCSSIYLASLTATEGLALGVANAGGQTVSPQADPRTRPVLGFQIEDLGSLEGKDAKRTRVKLYCAPILRSSLALVRRRGIVAT